MPALRLLLILAVAFTASGARARDLVEYYHPGLDHYFLTGEAREIQVLDAGTFPGWMRTGELLVVFDAGDPRLAGSMPICRFYGNPAYGLDSHFYPASPGECESVKQRFPNEWRLESDEVFRVHPLAAGGGCPAQTRPVYRLYNARADVNHRYTIEPAVVDAMRARGYVLEGAGSPLPAVFCAADVPHAQPAAGAPVCTLASDVPYPVLGTPVRLTATCSGTPTAFAWINCASYGPTCTAVSNVAGPVLYGIVATNASGAGNAARLELNWQEAATSPPDCEVTASATTLELGKPLVLTGTCSGPVARYEWLECSTATPDACTPIAQCPSATTCSPVGRLQGTALYALRGTNSAGTGAKASVTVNWVSGPGVPPAGDVPLCTVAATSTSPALGTTITLTATCSNAPTAYLWTNCTSTTSTCRASESSSVARIYYVSGRNAAGVGPAARVDVQWQVPATAAPTCTLTVDTAQPYAGGSALLTASCTQSPSSYQWTGCTPLGGNTCRASRATTGSATYTVTATNAIGTSAPATLTLQWQEPPPAGADFCGSFTKVKRIELTWGGYVNTNDPGGGLEADAVMVGRLRVPSSATGTTVPGVISVVEFIDGPAERVMSLSTSACDFRGFQPGVYPSTDPTGATRPLAWGFGNNPSTLFALAGMGGSAPKLIPGQTYYVNVRNIGYGSGQPTCQSEECNVRVTVNAPR